MPQSEQQTAVFGATAMAKALANEPTTKAEGAVVVRAIVQEAMENNRRSPAPVLAAAQSPSPLAR